jgi:two-component sensor histidine kinase
MKLNHKITDIQSKTNSSDTAEADHRIANHLAMLAGYVRLKGAGIVQRDQPPDANDVQNLIRMIVAQIDTISNLHRILSVEGNLCTLNLSASLSRMCDAINTSIASEIKIAQTFEKGCEIAPRSILPVTQICAEIITNALKHACNSDGPGDIRVACRKSSAGAVIVEISDSGPGLSDRSVDTEKDGLGIRLIDALIQQVDGRIEYLSTSQGLTVRVTLPAALETTASRTGSLKPNRPDHSRVAQMQASGR